MKKRMMINSPNTRVLIQMMKTILSASSYLKSESPAKAKTLWEVNTMMEALATTRSTHTSSWSVADKSLTWFRRLILPRSLRFKLWSAVGLPESKGRDLAQWSTVEYWKERGLWSDSPYSRRETCPISFPRRCRLAISGAGSPSPNSSRRSPLKISMPQRSLSHHSSSVWIPIRSQN